MTTDELKQFLGNHKWGLIVALAMLAMVGFGYKLANWEATQQHRQFEAQKDTLTLLNNENGELRQRVNQLEVAVAVVELEREALLEEMNVLQAQIVEQQERNTFYERVVSPEASLEGFVVEDVVLRSTEINQVQLQFVLMQHTDNRAVINGSVNIAINGNLNGAPYEITTADPKAFDGPIEYRFKYFQVVDIQIQMPEGFVPDTVSFTSTVYKFKRRIGNYSETILWADALI